MGIASMVLGILGLLLSFVPCVGMYGLVFTVPGIIFGALGIKKAAKAGTGKGMAIAGLVMGIVGTAIAIYWCMCVGAVASSANEVSSALQGL